MSLTIQTGNSVTVQSGNRVLISAPGPQGPAGAAGASEWGDITGTLSNQTDLASELANKVTDGGTVGSLTFQPSGLLLADASNDHYLTLGFVESTQNGTLNVYLNNGAARTLTISGNTTISGTNTGNVSLAGTPDYLTISGQTITRGLIDLTTDVTSVLPVANGGVNPLITTGDTGAGDGRIGFYETTLADYKYIQATTDGFDFGSELITAASFQGNGFLISALSANNISSGTLAVANGGTGATTLTANNVLLGNGTSAVQAVAPSTSGNVLTSNGTTWTSAAPATTNPAGSGSELQFRSSGTAFGAVTSSSVSGANITLGGTLTGITTLDATASGAALDRLLVSGITQIGWDGGSTTTAGSGAAPTGYADEVGPNTGSTAGSRSQIQSRGSLAVQSNDTGSSTFDWTKRWTFSFGIQPILVTTNGQIFIRIGGGAGTTGNLSGRGVGIRINNLTLVGQVHNGTTLTTTSTLATLTNQRVYQITIQSDGDGTVRFYVGNTLAATTTGGATTAESFCYYVAESINNADAASMRFIVSAIKTIVAP